MNLFVIVLKGLRKAYTFSKNIVKWFEVKILNHRVNHYREQLYERYVDLYNQDANDYCRELLESDKPCMISKFGMIELNALVQFKSIHQKCYSFRDYIQYIKNKRPTLWWNDGINALCSNAGFFPNDSSLLKDFYEVNIAAMKCIDVLGSYLENENYFTRELINAKKINIDGYYAPFFYYNPWTSALRGKKVLVIHPFETSIQSQYKIRKLLWMNEDVLPNFELITIKAEQTMLGQTCEYLNWFEALDSMKRKMEAVDFDIALIGAGAYGMPLAAHAKELGKKAVHLAGWTQVLFGIKGRRWVDMPSVAKYMNDYWVNPLSEEIPQNFKKVEDGCYW